MIIGFLYTIIGLILFLTGVNVGFAPVGSLLGSSLAGQPWKWILIPIGALIGYYIVKAEPAVQVLNRQVEDVTNGSISRDTMNLSLSDKICTKSICRHCLRLRRCCEWSYDFHFSAPACHGCMYRDRRKCSHRCFRSCCDGCHGTTYCSSGHGGLL